jgi:hypothetical protein
MEEVLQRLKEACRKKRFYTTFNKGSLYPFSHLSLAKPHVVG